MKRALIVCDYPDTRLLHRWSRVCGIKSTETMRRRRRYKLFYWLNSIIKLFFFLYELNQIIYISKSESHSFLNVTWAKLNCNFDCPENKWDRLVKIEYFFFPSRISKTKLDSIKKSLKGGHLLLELCIMSCRYNDRYQSDRTEAVKFLFFGIYISN